MNILQFTGGLNFQMASSFNLEATYHSNELNRRINIILPIALALIIPGLSYYANVDSWVPENLGFLKTWFIGSAVIYMLWHVLWFTWKIKWGFRPLWFLFNVLVFVGVLIGIGYFARSNGLENFQWYFVIRIVVGSLLFIAVQYSLRIQQNLSNLQLEKEQIETDRYKAQLKTLQTQVNPHFLFNSLNTLRSMVRQNHDNSEEFIMSLSDFYRKTLKHNEEATLPLSEELVVLKSYLFLMKNRNEEAIKVNINIDEKVLQYHLPTLSLQVVVENCFKHNTMTSKKPLHIDIVNTDDNYIEVVNNIQQKIGEVESSGYGLDLLKKRYELMKISQGVMTTRTKGEFSVKLKLVQS